MKDNRRDFLKKGASLAAAASIGGLTTSIANPISVNKEERVGPGVSNLAKDAGMQASEAYFSGMNERKIALLKQMNVFGAVGGINTKMVGLDTAKPFEEKSVIAVKEAWSKVGLNFNVVEGPPSLGEKTKLGLEGRDEEIANFITFMQSMSKAGIDTICYNWMPAIGWYRTDNARPGRGGALMTAFDYEAIKNAPLTQYGEVSKETLWKNLEYFLKAVVPEAEKVGMKLAMHPDDPQVDSIRGISRIMTSVDNFKRLVSLYPSPSNGITMCQGNFSLMGANIPETVKYFGKKKLIHFVHFRNVQDLSGKVPSQKFTETFHDEGQIDMYKAMQAYYDVGFRGPIRPDHVPTMAGDSNEFPGYSTIGSLFAWGYIKGLMEAVSKNKA
ncbi:mannonate dehydratase [Segetibacter aerophilus]|uniref:mannonate dehydratase n=1 Tax=Segetibacter aerophilus TaxID=670293 RepID=A0A512B6W7_9BACT|nr:mannonate dehydratase [Segetibacter aerophilus]GEO07699.1 mannonate dehydratase [Segetibacter aerophilus]